MDNTNGTPKRVISNAFKTTTKSGHNVYRIYVNTNEILGYLEEGRKRICIDILTNSKTGQPRYASGVAKTGRPWQALQYSTWAVPEKEDSNGATNGT